MSAGSAACARVVLGGGGLGGGGGNGSARSGAGGPSGSGAATSGTGSGAIGTLAPGCRATNGAASSSISTRRGSVKKLAISHPPVPSSAAFTQRRSAIFARRAPGATSAPMVAVPGPNEGGGRRAPQRPQKVAVGSASASQLGQRTRFQPTKKKVPGQTAKSRFFLMDRPPFAVIWLALCSLFWTA